MLEKQQVVNEAIFSGAGKCLQYFNKNTEINVCAAERDTLQSMAVLLVTCHRARGKRYY